MNDALWWAIVAVGGDTLIGGARCRSMMNC